VRDPNPYQPPARRRPWLVIVPVAGLVLLATAWCAFWFFAAGRAESELTRWREREAQRGRIYACANEAVGGFPFRIEMRCQEPSADFRRIKSVSLKAKSSVAAVQIYQPTLMVSEIAGPMTVSENGATPVAVVDWQLAQVSVRGLTALPERISAVFDKFAVDRLEAGAAQKAVSADHLEFHIRQAPRLPQDPMVLDLALKLDGALIPLVPQLATTALEADITAVLRGLDDLAPKPLAERLRQLQAANGRLEIRQARIRQGDVIGVGQGTLSLTAAGRLDGEVNLTIAGLDQLVTALGLDQAVARQTQSAASRLAPGLNLDKLLGPRGNAAIAAAGVAMLGRPAELEGRKAVTVPLRFSDGAVFLGPLPVGQMQPLF
jgi:hypothetical protein